MRHIIFGVSEEYTFPTLFFLNANMSHLTDKLLSKNKFVFLFYEKDNDHKPRTSQISGIMCPKRSLTSHNTELSSSVFGFGPAHALKTDRN